jgi:hypothetical protein
MDRGGFLQLSKKIALFGKMALLGKKNPKISESCL